MRSTAGSRIRSFMQITKNTWAALDRFGAEHVFHLMRSIKRSVKMILVIIGPLCLLCCCSFYKIDGGQEATAQKPLLTTTPNDFSFQVSLLAEWKMDAVLSTAWSEDSKMFAMNGSIGNSEDFGITTYDSSTFMKLWEHAIPGYLVSFAFRPDNEVVGVPDFAMLYLLDAKTGQEVSAIGGPKYDCFGDHQMKFTPDGSKIISADSGGMATTIYIWDTEAQRCVNKINEIGLSFESDMSSDGLFLVLGLDGAKEGSGARVHLWNIKTQELKCNFDGMRPALTSTGDLIAAAEVESGNINLWDAKSCTAIKKLSRKDKIFPQDMDFSPDGKWLAIGGQETFEVWDAERGELVFKSVKMPAFLRNIAFSPNGEFLLTVTDRVANQQKAVINLWRVSIR